MSLLSVRDLTVRLPQGSERPYALRRVSFDVDKRSTVCIVGESGSGKSVLAHSIVGLCPKGIEVESGSAYLQDTDLIGLDAEQLRQVRRSRVAMVFQDPMACLSPCMRIGDQIAEAIPEGIANDARTRWHLVYEALRDVGLPDVEYLAEAYPHGLSGGQRQRVMIAAAMIRRPQVLIADEPTTALDVTTQAQILSLLKKLQRKSGMGLIFITHDFGVVAEIAHSVVVMNKGEVVEQGDAAAVLRQPKHDYVRRLLDAVPKLINGYSDTAKNVDTALTAVSLGKTFERRPRWWARCLSTPALRDVSLSINKGEAVGIVGESGSGKSTLAKVLAGLLPQDAGTVTVDGASQNVEKSGPRSVQMIFQDPYGSLNPKKSVLQILTASSLFAGRPRRELHEEAKQLLARVGLPESALARRPHEFSGGQRQRIAIARALALRPRILIADEPVSALDVSIQAQILALIREVQAELGFGLLFITHDLRVAAQVCQRVLVMHKGSIVEQGPPARVLVCPEHEYTKKLVAAIPGRRAIQYPVSSRTQGEPASLYANGTASQLN